MHTHAHACGLWAGFDGVSFSVLLQMTLPPFPAKLQDFLRRTEGIQDRPVQPILCDQTESSEVLVIETQMVADRIDKLTEELFPVSWDSLRS